MVVPGNAKSKDEEEGLKEENGKPESGGKTWEAYHGAELH